MVERVLDEIIKDPNHFPLDTSKFLFSKEYEKAEKIAQKEDDSIKVHNAVQKLFYDAFFRNRDALKLSFYQEQMAWLEISQFAHRRYQHTQELLANISIQIGDLESVDFHTINYTGGLPHSTQDKILKENMMRATDNAKWGNLFSMIRSCSQAGEVHNLEQYLHATMMRLECEDMKRHFFKNDYNKFIEFSLKFQRRLKRIHLQAIQNAIRKKIGEAIQFSGDDKEIDIREYEIKSLMGKMIFISCLSY